MATCTPQTLLDDGACFEASLAGPGQWESVKLALLCQILQTLDPMAECDVQTLLTAGKCFYPAAIGGMGRTLELQLLCEINAAIGGGGVGSTQVYTGAAPPAAPDDPTKPAIFYPDNDALPLQVWNIGTLAWRII